MSQVQKSTSKQAETEEVEVVEHDVSEIVDAVDDLLDDIDDILEENALEFVNGFVQKGGELLICINVLVAKLLSR